MAKAIINGNEIFGNVHLGEGDVANQNIAEVYDPTQTYNTGDRRIYDDVLYVCNDDNVTGAWDSTKWDSATIDEIISALTADDIPYSSGVSVADKLATIPTILTNAITWSITPSATTSSLFKIGNVVFLNIRADFNSAIPVDTNICKLPDGFIPSVQTSIPAMASNNTAGSDNGWRTFNFKVLTNGYIQQGNTNGLKSFFISTMFEV